MTARPAVWLPCPRFGLPSAVALAKVKGGRLFADDGAEVEAWG